MSSGSSSCSRRPFVNGQNTSLSARFEVLKHTFCSKPWRLATVHIQRFTPTLYNHLFTDWRTSRLTSRVFCCQHWKLVAFRFKPVLTVSVSVGQNNLFKSSVSIRTHLRSSPTKCSDGTSHPTTSSLAANRMSLRKSWSRLTSHKTICAEN